MVKSLSHRAERVRVWVRITHTRVSMYPSKSMISGYPNNNLMYLLIFMTICCCLSFKCVSVYAQVQLFTCVAYAQVLQSISTCVVVYIVLLLTMCYYLSMCCGFKCVAD